MNPQIAALEVVEAIAGSSLSSSLVWFIHDRQIVTQMVDDLMELCHIAGEEEGEEGQKGGQAPDVNRSESQTSDQSDILLSGQAAEEAGMWLAATRAVVLLVCHSCRYSAALLSDMQDARGYEVLKHIILFSDDARRPEVLSVMAQLVGKQHHTHTHRHRVSPANLDALCNHRLICTAGAGVDGSSDRHGGGDDGSLGQPARNLAAFQVLRDVLIESTPILDKLFRNVRYCPFPELRLPTCPWL
jgi:hypothetical protein